MTDPAWMNNWELVAVGLAPGQATVNLALLSADGGSYTLTTTLQVFPRSELAVDASRDGAIKLDWHERREDVGS